jgi:hypothetical protein
MHHWITLILDNVWFDASMQILLIEEIAFYNLIVNWGQMQDSCVIPRPMHPHKYINKPFHVVNNHL